MRLLWYENGWEDYLWQQTQDKKTIKRVNLLIQDIQRSPFDGIGKPEPLKDNLSGWWSRRIDEGNRIVCRIQNDAIVIASCRNNYNDK